MAPNTGKFVCYYRVSTGRQGRSGLGLEAQKEAVKAYLNGGDWQIVDEFTEVESGRNSDRPALEKALAAACLHRGAIVVSKVDVKNQNGELVMSYEATRMLAGRSAEQSAVQRA